MLGQGTFLESVGAEINNSFFCWLAGQEPAAEKIQLFKFPVLYSFLVFLYLKNNMILFSDIAPAKHCNELLGQETFLESRGTKVNILVSGWLAGWLRTRRQEKSNFGPGLYSFFVCLDLKGETAHCSYLVQSNLSCVKGHFFIKIQNQFLCL